MARAQPRRPVNRGVKWGVCGLITPAILAAAAAVAVLSGSDAVGGVAVMTAMTIAFRFFPPGLSSRRISGQTRDMRPA